MARTPRNAEQKTTETPLELDPKLDAKKGKATPTRAQREAERLRPLVPNDRKEAARANREKQAAERDKARIGLAAGDEKYLPVRERGPQKKFIRDYVDSRFSIGELVLPLMFVVILVSFLPSFIPAIPETFSAYALYAVWAFLLLAIIDCVIMTQLLRRRLRAKFGDKTERIGLYASIRALQFRMLRMPKAQVKIGQAID
ncbi:DUF3043 domain-containing protein [Schumannella sp. 10F1B-5-1]|uniref:DUF3043 domain-containing protein n=1 Tax=Schumannella sp. 10F1B-5-1 TaxID=2590780 RepID=UPI0011318FC1|nr:DUF3043 domain-containing protein [Schumannella sp. 10F1B-5-1]TPW73818.1 DUF3043 domain-containing protein [Schumannella sp. 10F1B-5-1]